MTDIILIAGMGFLSEEEIPVEKEMALRLPREGTVFLNGKEYSTQGRAVILPRTSLRAENTLRVKDANGSFRCEGFSFDGKTARAEGFDGRAVLAALVKENARAASLTAENAAFIREEKRVRAQGLFL